MKHIRHYKKTILILLIILNGFFSFSMSFAYWASAVLNNNSSSSGNIDIGVWSIPITTPQEFYDFATKTDSQSTDSYYLLNDLDFTGFTWNYNASNNSVIFRGELLGNGKKIANLTINNFSSTYLYHGIFPRMDGGTIKDLTLENVRLELNNTSLSGTVMRAGLLVGDIYNGKTNTISNIKLIDSSVKGTSVNGVGGLIGRIRSNNTVVNISNIKATGLNVFSTTNYVGGIVGRISNNATVSIVDIDIEGNIYGHGTSSYTGGILGYINNNTQPVLIKNVIAEMGTQNIIETNPTYFLLYSKRYLGGIIGYHNRTGTLTTVENVVFLGSLYNNLNNRRLDVGTVTGRATVANTPTAIQAYYAFVTFRDATGNVVYNPDGTPTGQMSTLIDDDAYPSQAWWNSAYDVLSADNPLWTQDPVTGRPILDIN
jgi:uncharacterized membrane protein (UPF0136 family)